MNEIHQMIEECFVDSGDIREYRVLTVWQPYASLLVHGINKFETRPGPTSWTAEKGTYLIHAASKWDKQQVEICYQEPFKSELEKLGFWTIPNHFWRKTFIRTNLPLGQIIGAVEVTKCYKIQVRGGLNPSYWDVDEKGNPDLKFVNNYKELAFGDYREGRFAWECQNSRLLKNPIPYKGGQGYYQRYKGDKSLIEFI